VISIRSGNKTPEHAVGNTEFTSPEKSTHVSLAVQDRASVFLRSQGEVHCEFMEPGQTVNQHFYLEMLTRLRESIRKKRPEIWPDKWTLHHDNAHAHVLRFREFLAGKFITKMDRPPYSVDIFLRRLRAMGKLQLTALVWNRH
jgi:hypothetical protein